MTTKTLGAAFLVLLAACAGSGPSATRDRPIAANDTSADRTSDAGGMDEETRALAGASEGAEVHGRVTDARGTPVPGALAAVIHGPQGYVVSIVRTDDHGEFVVRAIAGRHGLSATAPRRTATFMEPEDLASRMAKGETIELRLGLPSAGLTLAGKVTMPDGRPASHKYVACAAWSNQKSDRFVLETDDTGEYTGLLPQAKLFDVRMASPGLIAETRLFVDGRADLTAFPADDPDPRLTAHLRRFAAPISDLAKEGLTGARVIGVGEATHGGKEFLQSRVDLLRALVAARPGPVVVAIEEDWAEVLPLGDYVQGAEADPVALVQRLPKWMWRTKELVAAMEWMRSHNARAGSVSPIYLEGMDVQSTKASTSALFEYVGALDSHYADDLRRSLEPLHREKPWLRYDKLTPDGRLALHRTARQLVDRFDKKRTLWSRRTSSRAWATARHHATSLLATMRVMDAYPTDGSTASRDVEMAANVQWLATRYPGATLFVWAHNGHVSRSDYGGTPSLGRHLAESFGHEYYAIGMAFFEGGFRGWDIRDESATAPARHTLGAPPRNSVGAILGRIDGDLYTIDLRKARKDDVVRGWLDTPRMLRHFGAMYTGDHASLDPIALSRHFDGLVFARKTHATTAL